MALRPRLSPGVPLSRQDGHATAELLVRQIAGLRVSGPASGFHPEAGARSRGSGCGGGGVVWVVVMLAAAGLTTTAITRIPAACEGRLQCVAWTGDRATRTPSKRDQRPDTEQLPHSLSLPA